MTRPLAIASGFAAGVLGLGVGIRALMAFSANAPPGEEGGAGADLFYAVMAFGRLAICGGAAALLVLWTVRRLLRSFSLGGALAIGGVLGAAAALAGGFGYLRSLHYAPLGRWAFLPQVVAPGLVAAALVVLSSSVIKARTSDGG